jgi:hypothetical protein
VLTESGLFEKQSFREAEIRRIEVQSQPKQIVCETLSRKKPSYKRAGGVTQGVGPEFKQRLIIQNTHACYIMFRLCLVLT